MMDDKVRQRLMAQTIAGPDRPKGRLLERLWLLSSAFYTLATDRLDNGAGRACFRCEATDKPVGAVVRHSDSNLPKYTVRLISRRGEKYLMFDVASNGRISNWDHDIAKDTDSYFPPEPLLARHANKLIESAILTTYRVIDRYGKR